MKLPFDLLSKNYIKPRIFLCETDKTKICQLETTDTQGAFNFNAYDELSFVVSRTYTDMITGETSVNPFYDKIEALRLIYLEGFGYFEIQEPEIESDGIKEVKNVTAYGLEYTLAQKYLEDFYINTGERNSVEVINSTNGIIIPVTLYNPANPKLSLLHLILEKIYGWTIGHVDDSLENLSRTFEISRESVYDFLVQEVCENFNCFIVFDTINNTINVYAESLSKTFHGDGETTTFVIEPTPYKSISSVSINGYKTTAYVYDPNTGILTLGEAPDSGTIIDVVDNSQEQWMTDVFVSFDNLAQEVNINYSADDIKTVLTVKGADDLSIREVNMGLPYIVDLSYYYTVDWMGQSLYDAYTKYIQKNNKSQKEYKDNSARMWELDHYISYEENRLSLQYSIADNVDSLTVGTYYVRGGDAPNYYYTEVSLPEEYNSQIEHYYTLSGTDLDEDKVSNLYEAFKTYFNSKDEKDVGEINNLKDSFAFMETHTIENLSSGLTSASTLEEKCTVILDFLDEMWDQIGRTPLNLLYYEPYQKIKATNEEAGWNNTDSENYWMYYPVVLIIQSLEKEIQDRDDTINVYEEEYEDLQQRNSEIANSLLVSENFTEEQLIRLSSFWREDEYTDSNFIETDSDTLDILMQTKQELLECGRIELSKLCEPKLEFSMTMANIYAIPEFAPLIYQFQLGNLIRIGIRNEEPRILHFVGDGLTQVFPISYAFDRIDSVRINGERITKWDYDAIAGNVVLKDETAPQVGDTIDIKLVKCYIKRSRLLKVNINFDDLSDFSCDFGDLTSLRTPSSIHADLLASAMQAGKSVASNASYWTKGANMANSTSLKIQQGLLDAATAIKATDGTQGISIDKYGIKNSPLM